MNYKEFAKTSLYLTCGTILSGISYLYITHEDPKSKEDKFFNILRIKLYNKEITETEFVEMIKSYTNQTKNKNPILQNIRNILTKFHNNTKKQDLNSEEEHNKAYSSSLILKKIKNKIINISRTDETLKRLREQNPSEDAIIIDFQEKTSTLNPDREVSRPVIQWNPLDYEFMPESYEDLTDYLWNIFAILMKDPSYTDKSNDSFWYYSSIELCALIALSLYKRQVKNTNIPLMIQIIRNYQNINNNYNKSYYDNFPEETKIINHYFRQNKNSKTSQSILSTIIANLENYRHAQNFYNIDITTTSYDLKNQNNGRKINNIYIQAPSLSEYSNKSAIVDNIIATYILAVAKSAKSSSFKEKTIICNDKWIDESRRNHDILFTIILKAIEDNKNTQYYSK